MFTLNMSNKHIFNTIILKYGNYIVCNCFKIVLYIIVPLLYMCSGCAIKQNRESQLTGFVGYIESKGSDIPQLKLIALEQDSPIVAQSNITHTGFNWSPTLEQIAYTARGNIYIQNIGETTSITIETNFPKLSRPIWTPTALIFAGQPDPNQFGMDLWKVDLPTSDLQLLVQCTTPDSPLDSCDSPVRLSNNRISYLRYSDTQANIEIFNPELNKTEIVVAGLLQIRPTTAPFGTRSVYDNGNYSNLSWSPDELSAAFVGGRGTFPSGSGIYIFETITQKLTKITPNTTWADNPIWVDKTHLLFRTRTWAKGAEIANSYDRINYKIENISIININTQEIRSLTQNATTSPIGINCLFYVPKSFNIKKAFP